MPKIDTSKWKQVDLSAWQSKVWDDEHRYQVINCGRRAGKSYLVALKMYTIAIEKQVDIWYVAPTYKQAKAIMWMMLGDLVPSDTVKKRNETELTIYFKNGSRILLKGADNPDSLRGVKIDFCVFDEVAFIDKWESVWQVIRPTLADSKANVMFISTPNGFNHFKIMAENRDLVGKPVFTDGDHSYHHFTSYDNPYIPKEEIDAAKLEMDPDSFAQEWLGEFRKLKGLIYKEFDRKIHMVKIPDFNSIQGPGWTFSRAMDFGFGHKTALVYFAIRNDQQAIYGYDGLYKEGMTESQIAEVVKTKDAGKVITNPVADSAQPMSIQQLQEFGVSFQPVEKGPDSVKHGIARVAELLKVRADTGKPTLMFNKDLEWIAHEFERYRWMENKSADSGTIKEVPNKVQDDAMDAIRYFAMSYKKQQSIPEYNKNKWSI